MDLLPTYQQYATDKGKGERKKGSEYRGRGSIINPPNRFEELRYEPDPEFLGDVQCGSIQTRFFRDHTRLIISRNESPDIPYEISLNPYRGCEHGCSYCYARPTHEYLGWSCGIDFETKIVVKTDGPELLRALLQRNDWDPKPLTLSGVTDPYQPAERLFKVTRGCLQVLAELSHPVCIVTKNAGILRDLDLLRQLACDQAVLVEISLTSLDRDLIQILEPRTSMPEQRLEAISRLTDNGIPVGVLVAPVIPGLTDHEIPRILREAREAGARWAAMSLIRLPYAVKDVFMDWLWRHFPLKRRKVENLIRQMRGGRLNDSRFGVRLTGEGPMAEQLFRWFEICRRKAGFVEPPRLLSSEAFFRKKPRQGELFECAPCKAARPAFFGRWNLGGAQKC